MCVRFFLSFFANFYSKHEYPKLKSIFDYYCYETSDTHTDSRNKQTPAFKCATHTYRNHKSVAFVIWTLSLTRFKYVTQLNHYNHWFIRHNRIVRSRVLAHISTNSYDSLHFTPSFSLFPYLPPSLSLSITFCRRHIFYRLNILLRATLEKFCTRYLFCAPWPSVVWESENEYEVWIA